MTYVTSDLHSNYNAFLRLLEAIRFSDKDTMHILGDLCDRGPDAAKLYLDVMKRTNVEVLAGNHEMMALPVLEKLMTKPMEHYYDYFEVLSDRDAWLWLRNGGNATLDSFFKETPEDQWRILKFIQERPRYRIIHVGDIRYVLVHGGLGDAYPPGGDPEVWLPLIRPYDMLWKRPDFTVDYFQDPNTYLIVGHTPTFMVQDQPQPTIYRSPTRIIDVDCGAGFPEHNGRLGCLCLETGQEFYVPHYSSGPLKSPD